MVNFSVIKLKSGETLFCRSTFNANNNRYLDVFDPFLVRTIELENNTESLYAAKWVPFTSHTQFSIPVDAIVLVAPLNNSYKRFYGLTHLKAELYDLNNVAINRIMRGEDKEHVLSEIFSQMNVTYSNIIEKTGNLEFDLDNFKKYIEKNLSEVDVAKSANFNFEAFEEDEDDTPTTFH